MLGSRDKLLTAETNDSALLASEGGALGARLDGGGEAFETGGAFGEVRPTIPLRAAANLGFDDGFSWTWIACWTGPGCCTKA